MNELSTVLLTIISTVAPLIGGGSWFFHRQNKRLKEAEARLAEVNVDKAKVETRAEDWHIWKEQCEALTEQNKVLIERNTQLVKINTEKENRLQESIKNWESRFTDQTTVLRGVQRDLIAANEKMITKEQYISTLRLYINWLLDWHCEREEGEKKDECNRRKPRQKVKLHYEPPTGIDSLLTQRNNANPTFVNEPNKESK